MLEDEFAAYRRQLKESIAKLPKGSKKWWRLNRELLTKQSPSSHIPPLKVSDASWATTATDKANLLATTFATKSAAVGYRGSNDIEPPGDSTAQLNDFLPVRCRVVRQVLKNLDKDVATGPDYLPAFLFKECAVELAAPIALIARQILQSRRWPNQWRFHWVVPLFKSGSQHDPNKYRGVHLTSVMSKVVERVIAATLVPHLETVNAFGMNQWAYRKGRSSRDMLALLTVTWLQAFDKGQKIGAFLSDISSAFDRVPRDRLCKKLLRAGVGERMSEFLADYLQPRSACVAVGGAFSELMVLSDMVFQGTVLGPPLWNVFFEDVAKAVRSSGAAESVFADDLNAFKPFDVKVKDDEVLSSMVRCQELVHQWGAENGVKFDPAKESFAILHHMHGSGAAFKSLGVVFDVKLVMDAAVDAIVKKAGPKITALLRTKPFYSVSALVQSYKAHVLSLLEGANGAIYHASNTVLARVDRLQDKFLAEIGISVKDAFLDFNLAPLSLRRDVGMLGLIFKCTKNEAHPKLVDLFQPAVRPSHARGTRAASARHDKQIEDLASNCHLDVVRRSVLGLIKVYNLLPQQVVDSKNVKIFQSELTKLSRKLCRNGSGYWQCRFSPRQPHHIHVLK